VDEEVEKEKQDIINYCFLVDAKLMSKAYLAYELEKK
jgi:hypothetical protein